MQRTKHLKLGIYVILACLFVGLSGCAQSPNSPPEKQNLPPAEPSSSYSPFVPEPGVPKVEKPLDITPYLQKPCDTMQPEQISSLLGAPVPGKAENVSESALRSTCSWARLDGSQASLLVVLPKVPTDGLSGIYRTPYSFFSPLEPVLGYPIVAYGIADDRPRGVCATAIGIEDQKFMNITVGLEKAKVGKADPCDVARQTSELLISNVRGK